MQFYYYMGYVSGVIEIEFSDFNTATIEEDITFTTREVPTSWDGIPFNEYDDGESGGAMFLPYAQNYLQTKEEIPFFGAALGDCFAWARDTFYSSAGRARRAICIWYDIPTDLDYTIGSSLKKVRDWLVGQGYEQTDMKEGSAGNTYEYSNGTLGIAVEDSQTLLYIYVWVEASAAEPAE